MYRNLGERPVRGRERGAGAARHRRPRPGAARAFGDFDNDGDVDVVVNNVHDTPDLFRARADPANHWIAGQARGHDVQPQRDRRAGALRRRAARRSGRRCAAAAATSRRTTCACTSAWAPPRASTGWRCAGRTASRRSGATCRPTASTRWSKAARRPPTVSGDDGARCSRVPSCGAGGGRPPRRRTSLAAARALIDAGKPAEAADRALQALDAARPARRATCSASPTTTRATPRKAIELLTPAVAALPPGSLEQVRGDAGAGPVASTWPAASAEAIPYLEQTRAALPGQPDLAYVLGMALRPDGPGGQGARRPGRAPSRVAPDSAAAHLLTAQMMVRAELDEVAEAELKQALAKEPAPAPRALPAGPDRAVPRPAGRERSRCSSGSWS